MTSARRRAWALRAFSWILGVPFVVWMALWGMWASALVGALLLVPFRRRWIGFVLLPLFVWNVSLREFSEGMHALADAKTFDSRQAAAVSGFNLLMAGLGFPLFPEVARETLWLTGDEPGRTIRRDSCFFLRDQMAEEASRRAWTTGQPQRLRWSGYDSADSVRVALALWVPDARVLRQRDLLVATGTIAYPEGYAAYVDVPTLSGPVPVGLDEGIFGTMQRDGRWQPYTVEWACEAPF